MEIWLKPLAELIRISFLLFLAMLMSAESQYDPAIPSESFRKCDCKWQRTSPFGTKFWIKE